jgi:hypothetical protein
VKGAKMRRKENIEKEHGKQGWKGIKGEFMSTHSCYKY